MFEPETVERDAEGFWLHSIAAGAEEETRWRDIPGADGMEWRFVHFDRDAPEVLRAMYDEGCTLSLSEGADWRPAIIAWQPTPPEGDSWFIAGIYETEDGPVCCFARPSQNVLSEGS